MVFVVERLIFSRKRAKITIETVKIFILGVA